MANPPGRIPPQATAKHINGLSDALLMRIFDRLPLVDLVHQTGRVCRRWNEVVQKSCKNRQMLTLIIANDNEEHDSYTFSRRYAKKLIIKSTLYRDFTHQIGEATGNQANELKVLSYSLLYIKQEACLDSVERIVCLFPSIIHLEVSAFVEERFGLEIIPALLQHYGRQLVSLKLHSDLIISHEDVNRLYNGTLITMQPILNTIGAQLPKLVDLTLTIDGCFDNLISVAAALPVFPRLHQLCICSEKFGIYLKPSQLQLDAQQLHAQSRPNEIHRHTAGFRIGGPPRADSKMDITEGNAAIDHILSKIAWAQFYCRLAPLPLLNKLTGLKGLYFGTGRHHGICSEELFSQLARLDTLVYLYLHAWNSLTRPSARPQLLLSPLRSIRWLKLKWEHKYSHADILLGLQLPHTFPQLHTLTLRCAWQDCNECYPKPILREDFKNYPKRCWCRLEAEVSEIYAQMPWLTRLDYECSGEEAELEMDDDAINIKAKDGSDPKAFLYSRLEFSRVQPPHAP